MLSINQLQMSIQALEDSNHSNTNTSKKYPLQKNLNSDIHHSSSRSLLKKCKQIIHEQMLQIQLLQEENHQQHSQIHTQKHQNTDQAHKIANLHSQISQITAMNQTLHKQMLKLTQTIEQLTQNASERENIIKLTNNKNEALQGVVKKLKQEKEVYEEKCETLEGIIKVMKEENFRLSEFAKRKQDEIRGEIQKLKKFKQTLEKRNHLNQIDFNIAKKFELSAGRQDFGYKVENQTENVFKTISFKRYPSVQSNNQSLFVKPQKNLSDCKTMDRTFQKQHSFNKSMHSISPFSIVDQKQSVSRIRKNQSKPKPHNQLPETSHFKQFRIASKNQYDQTPSHNPEIRSELSNIKKELMKQYNLIEVKKEMMSQGMIGKTLKQIEKKLVKMTKLSQEQPSQSQFQ